MFFVTKKVLINTKVFCNVSNPLNLRYNKQTKFCSYILGNGQKMIFRFLQGSSTQPFREVIEFVSWICTQYHFEMSNVLFNYYIYVRAIQWIKIYCILLFNPLKISLKRRDIIKVSKRYNYSATSRVIHLGTSFLGEQTNKHPDICIYLCKWVREDEHNL